MKLDLRPQIMDQVSDLRRQVAAASPSIFADVYLGHHFTLPRSRMHNDLFEMLLKATNKRGARLAVAAPRGHAKITVVSLAYVLWSVLYSHEKFVLLVSATKEQAETLLKGIKDELQGNPLLIQDFPELCYPPGRKSPPKPWRRYQIVLRNKTEIRAVGADQAIRGVKSGPHRPSLIVADDLEEKDQVASADLRQKRRDWFEGTLLKIGTPQTNAVVVGTILHYASLLAELTDPRRTHSKAGGWRGSRYKAVESFSANPKLWDQWESIYTGNEMYEGESGERAAAAFRKANVKAMLSGTKVLWPQLENYTRLMKMRANEGRYSFQSEKQNEPVDPEQCVFAEREIRFWDDQFADIEQLIASLGSNVRFFGACDPSLGHSGRRGDYTAIVTLIEDYATKRMYVIGADLARRSTDRTIEAIVQLARHRKFYDFAVEANQFQELLADQLQNRARAAGVHLSVKKIKNTVNKRVRIQALQPLIAQGQIQFSRQHQALLDQMREFPLGAYDDGPDALEMAVSIAHQRHHFFEVTQF